jgi:hypothetical protein
MKDLYDLRVLRECFELHEDGTLIWKSRPAHHFKNEHGMNIFNAKYAGKPVGSSIGPKGHRTIPITFNGQKKRRRPSFAKVVYMLHHDCKVEPGMVIDHIDGDPGNNHPSNLHAVTYQENNRNAVHRPGRSGFVGVRERPDGWYEARIGSHSDGEFHYLGLYKTAEEAYAAYVGAGVALGYTPRHLRAGCPDHHTPPVQDRPTEPLRGAFTLQGGPQ